MLPRSFYNRLCDTLQIALPGELEKIKDNLYIKRDDLLHPVVSGNKWRKLLGYLYLNEQEGDCGILTFGGAYSNHLHATAKVCKVLGISFTAVIKGFPSYADNPTLSQIRKWGADLIFLPPTEYEKEKTDFRSWKNRFPKYTIVPEGGKGRVGRWGFEWYFDELETALIHPALFVVPAGTGTTSRALANRLPDDWQMEVWPVVAYEEVQQEFKDCTMELLSRINLRDTYSKPFAAWDTEVVRWIVNWYEETGILFDPVYTGPVYYRVLKESHDVPVVLYHSGGLQGWRGFIDRYGNNFDPSHRKLILRHLDEILQM